MSLPALSLRRNFSWTLAGNIIYSACQWGIFVLLAKLLSPEDVGKYALGLAISGPVIGFANLQLRSVLVTDAKHEYAYREYMALRLVTMVIAILVIGGIAFASDNRSSAALVVLLVGLVKSAECVSDLIHGLIQKYERMDRIAKALAIKGTLSLAFLGVALLATHRLVVAVAALSAAYLLVLLTYEARVGRTILESGLEGGVGSHASALSALRPQWRTGRAFALVRLSLPLGFVMMLTTLNVGIPQYFIRYFSGSADLGIYSALSQFIGMGRLVATALALAAVPRMASYYARGDVGAYSRLLSKLVMLSALVGLGGIAVAAVFGRHIINLFYREEYAAYNGLFIWIMAVGGVGYIASFLGYGMNSARQFRAQVPLFAVVAAVTAAGCWVLVPRFGLYGATYAMLIALVVQVLLSLVVIRRARSGLREARVELAALESAEQQVS